MIALGPEQARCLVFTFKEGLLSTAGHDLELRVTALRLELSDGLDQLEARFDAASLRVERTRVDGRPGPRPSERDCHQIESTVAGEVLQARRYPEIRFRSTAIRRRGDTAEVAGELTLCGHTRPLTVEAHRQDTRWTARLRLHQPDFGIRPYSALLGALRVRPDVEIELTANLPPV